MFVKVRLTTFLLSINLSEVCYFCNIKILFWNTPVGSSKYVSKGRNSEGLVNFWPVLNWLCKHSGVIEEGV
jgi:hypothetical protein